MLSKVAPAITSPTVLTHTENRQKLSNVPMCVFTPQDVLTLLKQRIFADETNSPFQIPDWAVKALSVLLILGKIIIHVSSK